MRNYCGAAVLLEEAPNFEFREGIFYACITVGGETLCFGLRPHMYFKAVARSVETARQFRLGGGGAEIVPFPEVAAGH